MEINNIDPNEIKPETNLYVNPQEIPPKKIKTFPVVLVLGIVIGIVLTASIASAFYFYQVAKTNSLNTTSTETPTPIVNSSQTTQFGIITWLNKPQKISPLTIFNDTTDYEPETPISIFFSKTSYYLVANFSDGSQLIDVLIPPQISNTNLVYRLIKSSSGELSIINSGSSIEEIKDRLLPSIKTIDLNLIDLNPPETIVVNKSSFIKYNYFRGQTFDSLSNPKLISSTEFGDFYNIYDQTDNSELYAQYFYLKLKDWIVLDYESSPYDFMNDDNTTKIQWNDGIKNTDQFVSKVNSGGCGGNVGGRIIIKNSSSSLDDKVAVGTYNQKTIYQLKNTSNPIVQKLYKEYKDSTSYGNNAKVLSLDDFTKNIKNHFIYQDLTGDWVLFINQSYTLQAECGKPVIYLYPTKETQVSVKVGAKITKSEPEYPTNGWAVIAKPNGELSYQNKIYPSLFWEGLGNGFYPNYKNRGTVVAQKDLISTIYSQLSQQGLNKKESADFMDFWQSRLPATPYVRLTWLNTQDMDTLAPLAVSPKPDTKIRIFLEFEGLQNPIKLIPQELSAPTRNGFTLIEWGGLLLKNK